MGATFSFEREKLVIGVIFHDEEVLNTVLSILTEKFGEIDAVCEEYSFSKGYSTYYDNELGGEGRRRIYSFESLVDPSLQAEIKEYTNELEKRFSKEDGGRLINLDGPLYRTYVRLWDLTRWPRSIPPRAIRKIKRIFTKH